MDNSDRERLIAQNGDRPLEDLASARLSSGAGIVLPSVDHALRPCPALRRCRTCPAPALASQSRSLRRAFRSLCHVFSPVPESSSRRGELANDGGLAIMAGSVALPGELDHVYSTIRRRRSSTPTADTSSLPCDQCVAPTGRRTVNTEPLPGS